MNTKTVKAYKSGYEVTDYTATTECTVDGKWTTDDEWTDADTKQLDGSLDAIFRLKYITDYPSYVNQYYLIEVFDDTTNDTGDYIQICYEAPADVGGTPIGGTTPQTDCKRWDYEGNVASGFTYYVGDGAAWVESNDYNWNTDIKMVTTFDTSPLSSTPHLIAEVMIEHMAYSIGTPQWIRIAAYDASHSAEEIQSWPESSVNAPSDWGLSTAEQTTIPEGITMGVMVFLSSVSVVVGSRYLHKRSKNRKL
jgi:hypothetical protein